MRATISATTLLLAATALPLLAAAPAHAAATCADATTTWIGPADGASNAWDEPANWTHGVPTATSVVCIEAASWQAAPVLPERSTVDVAGWSSSGLLTVGGSLTTDALTAGNVDGGDTTLGGGGRPREHRERHLGRRPVRGRWDHPHAGG